MSHDFQAASACETSYIQATSRQQTVEAYSQWTQFSPAEQLLFSKYIPDGAHVLDLGCGVGRALWLLQNQPITYVGIDASEAMLAEARRLHPSATFRKGDIIELQEVGSGFDVILLLHNVIDYLNPQIRRAALLGKIHETLRPGGVVIASSHIRKFNQTRGYHNEDYHGASVANFRSSLPEWCEEIEGHGLEVQIAIRDFRNGCCDWTYLAARKT